VTRIATSRAGRGSEGDEPKFGKPIWDLTLAGTNERRRLVVRGIDKEQLVQWMQTNAKLDDVQSLVRLLRHVRWMFGLAYGEELPKALCRAH
jgi:hypothetical protein